MGYRDVKIETQLRLAFCLILAPILATTMLSLRQSDKTNQIVGHIYNHSLAARGALSDFDIHVLNMMIEFRNILLATDEEPWQKALLNHAIQKDQAVQSLDALEKVYSGDEADIDSLRVLFLDWVTRHQLGLEKSSFHKIDEGLLESAEKGGIAQARSSLLSQIQKIDDYSLNEADLFYREAVRLAGEQRSRSLVFSLAALVLSLLLVLYLSRLVNTPLKELAAALDSFRSGDKSVRCGYKSKNLFGKLADTFNEMADTVETDEYLSNRSADLAGHMLTANEAHTFCMDILRNLLEHTRAQMGAVYLLSEDKTRFEHFACIGMNPDGCNPFSAVRPEGEFGLALTAKRICHIKDIPEDSGFRFTTVSGSFKPKELLTVPIFHGEQAVAIFSLINLRCFTSLNVRLVERIYITLTARMNGVLAYKRLRDYSARLEEQNIELDTQKQELDLLTGELKMQNDELEAQKHQLSEVSRLKTNFLSNMSHELRTPLNSVIALSGVLGRRLAKKIGEEEYGYLGAIERNGKHLLELINDILDLSRIESGKVELEENNFRINTLLADVVAMIKPQAEQKSIALDLSADQDDTVLESDYGKCYHIFQNIIGNAVKFTDEGGVNVSARTKHDALVVEIRDTGIGISPEELPRIFDEFHQADGSSARRHGGTGLGLAIVEKYAQLLGCSVDVESKLGAGTIFKVTIPLKSRYGAEEQLRITPTVMQPLPKAGRKPAAGGKTVLLVEDAEAIAIQIKDVLETEGYSVVSAGNGFEALAYLEDHTPDALLLDLMMPGMDGLELLNIIRAKDNTAFLPVLVLTAKNLSREELKLIKSNHAHQLLQKGMINRDSLLGALELLILSKEDMATLRRNDLDQVPLAGKPVILAVEDDADNLLALKALLADHCELVEAVNGDEGLEKAETFRPHVILMDIAMPGMNGFEAFKALRENPALQNTPVIALTSGAMAGDKKTLLDYGFNGYLSKPIDRELLFKELKKWLIGKNDGDLSHE